MYSKKNSIVATLLALLPGMGHFYLRDIFFGVLYLATFWIGGLLLFLYCKSTQNGYKLMYIFLVLWIVGIVHAFFEAKKLARKLEE